MDSQNRERDRQQPRAEAAKPGSEHDRGHHQRCDGFRMQKNGQKVRNHYR
jgi:hypothetical protein